MAQCVKLATRASAGRDQAFLRIGNNNNAFVEAWERRSAPFHDGFVDGDFNVDFRIQVDAPPLHDYAFIL
jgi:hypothetical protein